MKYNMKRIEEIDFTRVVAMIGVIIIHVTAEYIYSPSRCMLFDMNLAFLLNQMFRFAVPLFVLLSGLSLGLSGQEITVFAFYKKRVTKIGIPYLLWSIVYILYSCQKGFNTVFSGRTVSLAKLFRLFLLGNAAPHLYFIVILLQLYLLYPILKKCAHCMPFRTLLFSFTITYLVQMSYNIPQLRTALVPPRLEPYLWFLFPSWIFYFVLGVLCSRERLIRLCECAQKNAVMILAVEVLVAFLYAAESATTGNLGSIKVQLNIFTLLTLFACLGCWKYFMSCLAIRKVVCFLADRSMTIYFAHMLVLFFLQPFPIFKQGMSGMFLLCAIVFVLSVLLATVIDFGLKRIRNRNQNQNISLYQ